ncbi:MAG: TIGR02281 family clan AA aspartic protease [Pseudomonadota bacterium]
MGLLFRLVLIALFALGVYALELKRPEALEKPEAVAAFVVLGLVLLASLFEGRRRRDDGVGAAGRASRRDGRAEASGARAVERGGGGRRIGFGGEAAEPMALQAAPSLAALRAEARRELVDDDAWAAGPGFVTQAGPGDRQRAAGRAAAGAAFAAEPIRPDGPALAEGARPPRRRAGRRMRAAMLSLTIWVGVVGGLAAAYGHRFELKESALLAFSALQPGAPVALSHDEAVLMRDRGGHFTTIVRINDQNVRMLVDTGSSDVALPYEEARRLGVDLDHLSFTRVVMTANGQAMVAPVTLPAVTVGPITLTNIAASVAEPGRLGTPLLGMSFLGGLSEVSIRGEELRLRR